MATWELDPGIAHLNHGSFGATPVEVLAEQTRIRAEMEANPVSFMLEKYQPSLEEARAGLARFVNADSGGVVFVPNATYGVNSVLRSLEPFLTPGSEILVTNHGYNACANAVEVSASRVGATVVVAAVPVPATGPDVVEAILARVSERTKLVVVDHVTSPTGIVFPVEKIVAALEPDIPVLIDGAHAPGMVPVDLGAIGASFYTANCHKWICAPKGSGFLFVAERFRDAVQAVSISHGHNDGWPGTSSRFHAQFDWTGTDDPSARLSVGKAIEAMGGHRPDGWDGIRRSNHDLVMEGRRLIADALDAEVLAPEAMIGSIAAIRLPPGDPSDNIFDPLMIALRHNWKIEVPVFAWPDPSQRLIRISAQQYNTEAEYRYLAEALLTELG
jgi:isopenicillin-N epimerase